MILHPHMLKVFIVIDHAIKTRLDLFQGVMTPEQRATPHYKVCGISAWRELERVAMDVMADEWMWRPEVTSSKVKDVLLWNLDYNRYKESETSLDKQIYEEIVQYVTDLFDATEVETTAAPKNTRGHLI